MIEILPPPLLQGQELLKTYLDVNFRRIVDSVGTNLSTSTLRVTGTVTSPGSARFWTGIEIANPTSDPFIDFHRSSNPEEATDYNIRLINQNDDELALAGGWLNVGALSTSGSNHWTGTAVIGEGFIELYGPNPGTPFIDFHVDADINDYSVRLIATTVDLLEVHGGNLEINDVAQVGSNPFYGTNYAWFGHKDMGGSGQYAIMQDNVGNTLINCATGKDIGFRINNATYMYVNPTGGLFITVIATSSGTAVHRLASGQITLISSSIRYKKDFVPMDLDDIDQNPLWSFRPGRFHWKKEFVLNAEEENLRCPKGIPGMLAEEVAELDPAVVALDAEGLPQSINELAVIGLLVTACHQLRRKITVLEDKLPSTTRPEAKLPNER